jgi:hypothetical protein
MRESPISEHFISGWRKELSRDSLPAKTAPSIPASPSLEPRKKVLVMRLSAGTAASLIAGLILSSATLVKP